jgi:hypothetical protein
MDLSFACGLCGADPATDSMLVHSAIAAVSRSARLHAAQSWIRPGRDRFIGPG